MHRILLYIITTLLAIAAFACGETHYDSRLTAIDSIIDVSPDSALAELRALDYKSLSAATTAPTTPFSSPKPNIRASTQSPPPTPSKSPSPNSPQMATAKSSPAP